MNAQSKVCFKCGVCKPLELYYVHSEMADGRLNKCVACTKDDVRRHRQANLERVREYDRYRGRLPHRLKAVELRAEAHPDRARATKLVHVAIQRGLITPWPVCAVPECNGKPNAHHPDYSRPLDVVWLCRSHHQQTHALTRKSVYVLEEAGYEVDAAGTFTG